MAVCGSGVAYSGTVHITELCLQLTAGSCHVNCDEYQPYGHRVRVMLTIKTLPLPFGCQTLVFVTRT